MSYILILIIIYLVYVQHTLYKGGKILDTLLNMALIRILKEEAHENYENKIRELLNMTADDLEIDHYNTLWKGLCKKYNVRFHLNNYMIDDDVRDLVAAKIAADYKWIQVQQNKYKG